MTQYDTIIRGGTLIDGTGTPGVVGDLAILDGQIAAVGEIAGSATKINTTVKNMFEGTTINLKAGSRVMEGCVEEIAANVQMSNGKTT